MIKSLTNHNKFKYMYIPEKPSQSRYVSKDETLLKLQAIEVLEAAEAVCSRNGIMFCDMRKKKNISFRKYGFNHLQVITYIKRCLQLGNDNAEFVKATRNDYRGEDGKPIFPQPSFSKKAHMVFIFRVRSAEKMVEETGMKPAAEYHGDIYVRLCESRIDRRRMWLDSFHGID